jgi:hypothetical protein
MRKHQQISLKLKNKKFYDNLSDKILIFLAEKQNWKKKNGEGRSSFALCQCAYVISFKRGIQFSKYTYV